MTTIITRLYSDKAAAQAVVAALQASGHRESTIQVITGDAPGGASQAMLAAMVSKTAVAAYTSAMTGAQALLVVQAPFNPVGTARDAMRVVARHPSIDVGLEDEDGYVRINPTTPVSTNVLTDHPYFMSNKFRKASHGHILGDKPLLAHKTRISAMRGGGHMSKMFWPMKLVSKSVSKNSVIKGGWLVSSMFGITTLLRR